MRQRVATFRRITKRDDPKKSVSGRMAKADGRPAVEAWLHRVKPELQPLVRRIDRLVLEAMPHVVCAVKWGVPFYGLPGQGWIAGVNSNEKQLEAWLRQAKKLPGWGRVT